jgi:hypothetical protein
MGNCITYSWNKGAYMHTEALSILIAWCEGSATILTSLLICYHVLYYTNVCGCSRSKLKRKMNETFSIFLFSELRLHDIKLLIPSAYIDGKTWTWFDQYWSMIYPSPSLTMLSSLYFDVICYYYVCYGLAF